MRILLIHQYFLEKDDPGGSRFNEMAQLWTGQGHEIVVICGMLNYVTGKIPKKYKGKRFDVSYYNAKLKVHRAYVSSGYNSSFFGRLWAYFSFVWFGTCAGLKERKNFDIILATSPPLFIGIIAMVLSQIKRIKFVFEVRDLWPESAIETGVVTNKLIIKLSYWLEKKIYKKAFLINVLTPAFKSVLVSKKNIPNSKLFMIPNASDFNGSEKALRSKKYLKIKNELNLHNCLSVIYIGAHGVANHLDQVLDAAILLKNEGVRFILVGDGMDKNRLVKRVEKEQIANIEFVDPVPKEEVYNYILASDIGISVLKNVTTFKTVYSNKTFDYMACKKPVIMAIDGVSKELIQTANSGLFAEPENADAIANQILVYKNDKELLYKHGHNGYVYAKSHFDRVKLSKEYMKEINEKLACV